MAQRHHAFNTRHARAGGRTQSNILRAHGEHRAAFVQKVHLADEPRHKTAVRVVVNFGRAVQLFNGTLVHDGNAVGDGHGLLLVVRDEDDSQPGLALDALELLAHLAADLGVQCRKRLVQQKYGGPEHQCACNGHTLLLAAGKLSGVFLFAAAHFYKCQHLRDLRVHLLFGRFAKLQAECHILVDGHMRPQVVALEYHTGGTLFGRQALYFGAVQQNFAGIDLVKAADGAQDGGFAAAGWSEQR